MATPEEIAAIREELAQLRALHARPVVDAADALRQEYSNTAYALTGLTPGDSHRKYRFNEPQDLPHFARNPVPRPPGVRGTDWFRLDTTATGLAQKEALGAKSGYWAECEAWGPILSGLFDAVSAQLLLLGSTDCPAEVRAALKGSTHALKNVLDQAALRWHYHQLRASQGASAAQAFLSHQRLKHSAEAYLPEEATAFDELLASKLADKQAKSLASGSGSSGAKGGSAK